MHRVALATITAFLLALVAIPGAVSAQEGATTSGDVLFIMRFKEITLSRDSAQADIESTVFNLSDQRLRLQLEVRDAPQGWVVRVLEMSGDYQVGEIALEPLSQADLLVRVTPPSNPGIDTHKLTLRLTSADGDVMVEELLTVASGLTRTAAIEGAVTLSSVYPSRTGFNADDFIFDVVARNESEDRQELALVAQGPDRNWQIFFIPVFEENRIISSIGLNRGGTQVVKAHVIPPRQALPGTYPIAVSIFNENYNDQAILQVTLTGQGELRADPEGGLLDVAAQAGEATSTHFTVDNIGTGPVQRINLLADIPEGWEVTFDPDLIDLLPAGEKVEVNVTITPAADAVPGDYRILLTALNPQANTFLDIRVLVGKSFLWQAFGLAMMILVLSSLVGLYIRLTKH